MPVTLIKSKWSSGSLIFYPKTDDTGAINIGDGTYDCDFKVFLGDTSTYVSMDVGAQTLYVTSTARLSGTTVISGAATLSGAITLSGTVGVTGAAALSGTTVISGAATLSGAAALSGTTVISGAASFTGTIGMTGVLTLGTSTTNGIDLSDSTTSIAAIYGDLPSGGSALTANTVIRSTYNYLYVDKAQTSSVNLYADVGYLGINRNVADGLHFGVFGACDFLATAAIAWTAESMQGGVYALAKSTNNLTVGTSAVFCGILVEGAIGSSATINGDTSAVWIQKQTATLSFEFGLTFENCVSTAYFNFPDGSSGTVISDSTDGTGTASGYIAVKIGGNTRYIYTCDNAPA